MRKTWQNNRHLRYGKFIIELNEKIQQQQQKNRSKLTKNNAYIAVHKKSFFEQSVSSRTSLTCTY